MTSRQGERWRRSTRCSPSQCVEVSSAGAVRDSKNPTGPTLRAVADGLVAAVKAGQIGR